MGVGVIFLFVHWKDGIWIRGSGPLQDNIFNQVIESGGRDSHKILAEKIGLKPPLPGLFDGGLILVRESKCVLLCINSFVYQACCLNFGQLDFVE